MAPVRIVPARITTGPAPAANQVSLNATQIEVVLDRVDKYTGEVYQETVERALMGDLFPVWGVDPTAACAFNETEACLSRPIVSCQDEDKGVIFVREADDVLVDVYHPQEYCLDL